MISIAVFGSSLPLPGEPAYEEALEVGRCLARRRARVVCGGYGGVMEAACRGASEEGGTSLGIVLIGRGKPNPFLTDVVAAENLAERLQKLRDLSQGWIFLPRGLGTMLELIWMAESVVKREAAARPLVLSGDFWLPTVNTILSEATGPAAKALSGCIQRASSPEEAVTLALGQP